VWNRIGDLSPEWKDRRVLLRGRLHTSRAVGKGIFVLVRQAISSVQGVLFQSNTVRECVVKIAVMGVGRRSGSSSNEAAHTVSLLHVIPGAQGFRGLCQADSQGVHH